MKFEYFKSFCRVRLRCSSAMIAEAVRSKMNGAVFMGTILKISIAKVLVIPALFMCACGVVCMYGLLDIS